MGQHHEVIHERLYLKEPRTNRLRKRSAARLRHLLASGWRETDRQPSPDYIMVRLERSGVAPLMTRMPKVEQVERPPRRGPGQGGAGGGPRR